MNFNVFSPRPQERGEYAPKSVQLGGAQGVPGIDGASGKGGLGGNEAVTGSAGEDGARDDTLGFPQ